MAGEMSYERQSTILNPARFGNLEVSVVGVGGVGGYLVWYLKKHGISNVHGYDGKCVSALNPPGQIYGPRDIGKLKTDALAECIDYMDLGTFVPHPELVTPETTLGEVVFLCIDHQMELRKQIVHNVFKQPSRTKLLIETRVDANFVVIHSVIPSNPEHLEIWDHFWFPDSEAENNGGCAEPIAFGATSITAAVVAFSQMVQWFGNGEKELLTVPDNQIRIRMRPFEVMAKQQW